MGKSAARRAIELSLQRVHTKTALGRELGVTRQAISQWGDTIPPEHVAKLSAMSGVPCHEIRPDIFPRPDAAA